MPLIDLCFGVTSFAGVFLILASVFAFVEAILAMFARWRSRKTQPKTSDEALAAENVGTVLDGLARVLAALKDLPPWIGIFLASLALIWTASAAPHLCT